MSRGAAVPAPQVQPGDGGDAIIVARGLTFNGEHGPMFSAVDLTLNHGLHAVHMPVATARRHCFSPWPAGSSPAPHRRRVRRHRAAGHPKALRDSGLRRHRRSGRGRHRGNGRDRAAPLARSPCSGGRVPMPTETCWL